MPAYKGSRVLGTMRGGAHAYGTAPAGGATGTQGPRTTDRRNVGRRPLGSDDPDEGYVRALRRKDKDKERQFIIDTRRTPLPSDRGQGHAKGGSVSKRADGCAKKGKTRGKMV